MKKVVELTWNDPYVVVMGLVLGQSLMVISTMGILLYAKVSPLYNVLCALLLFTRKVHCLQILWQVNADRVIDPYLGTKVKSTELY